MTPQDGPQGHAQAATPATPTTEATPATEDGSDPLRALRDQVYDALHATWPGDYHDSAWVRCRPCDVRARAVMDAIGPTLDRVRRTAQCWADMLKAAEHTTVSAEGRALAAAGQRILDILEAP